MKGYESQHSLQSTDFDADYELARDRFQECARRQGAELHALPISAVGPQNGDLTIDIAWFGSKTPRRVLIHTCGLHGVEAFAGFAVQMAWLKSMHPRISEECAIVLVHALNPYGMAWLRRFNENNVDLNRNFRTPEQFVPQPIPHWEAVNRLLNPRKTGGSFRLGAIGLILRYGMARLRQAIAGGQMLNPQGLFYAGDALQEGPAKFEAFLKQHFSGVEKIIVVDVHTGLGKFGEDVLLVDADPQATRKMRQVFGDRVRTLAGSGIAYEATGSQQDLYMRTFPGAELYFVTQEFGTYSGLRVLEALRSENLYHTSTSDIRVKAPPKMALREAFSPNDFQWRKAVLARGKAVFHQAFALTMGQVPGSNL